MYNQNLNIKFYLNTLLVARISADLGSEGIIRMFILGPILVAWSNFRICPVRHSQHIFDAMIFKLIQITRKSMFALDFILYILSQHYFSKKRWRSS